MRFSDNGYYVTTYVKCDNCGMLIYDKGLQGADETEGKLFCSDWCHDWATAKARGVEDPRIPLPRTITV